MKITAMQIKYDAEKLSALQKYAEKKEVSIEEEMIENLTRLYEKYVPAAVREFIDMNAQEIEIPKGKKKKQESQELIGGATKNLLEEKNKEII